MIMTLCWLTVSTPFVYRFQQEYAKAGQLQNKQSPLAGNEEESSKPISSTEEKTPNNSSLTEEYLHDHHATHPFVYQLSLSHTIQNDRAYTAFHGELLVPPPNAA